jgi:hypothetical protein
LHNRYKQKLRQEDEALFEYMKNATSLTSWTLVEVKKESYRYWSPEEGRFVHSGVVVLKIQKDIMYPATLHVPVELIDVVTTITLKGVGTTTLSWWPTCKMLRAAFTSSMALICAVTASS